MHCNNCGYLLEKGVKYCHNCGAPNPEMADQGHLVKTRNFKKIIKENKYSNYEFHKDQYNMWRFVFIDKDV